MRVRGPKGVFISYTLPSDLIIINHFIHFSILRTFLHSLLELSWGCVSGHINVCEYHTRSRQATPCDLQSMFFLNYFISTPFYVDGNDADIDLQVCLLLIESRL